MKIYQPNLYDGEWGDRLKSWEAYTDKDHCQNEFPDREILEYDLKDIEDVSLVIPDEKEWCKTDTNQWGRSLLGGRFEFKEFLNPWVDGEFIELDSYWKEAEINLNQYTNDAIQSCLNSYGYKYNSETKTIADCSNQEYSKNDSAWIIAECLFESDI